MQVEWKNGENRNPFQLSARILFPFGGLRDSGQQLRDLMDLNDIDRRAHMARLLGLSRLSGGPTLYRWFHRERQMGPSYILRLMILLLWARRGYRLADLWSVDWEDRTVEWQHGRRPPDCPVLPSNPFRLPVPAGGLAPARPWRRLRLRRPVIEGLVEWYRAEPSPRRPPLRGRCRTSRKNSGPSTQKKAGLFLR